MSHLIKLAFCCAVVAGLFGLAVNSSRINTSDLSQSKKTPPSAIKTKRFQPQATIILAGDSGVLGKEGAELLLNRARISPQTTDVIFLGDNIYPNGMPEIGSSEYAEALDHLNRSLQIIQASGARAIYVPGNHDWNTSRSGGWDSVKRQELLVRQTLGAGHFFPQSGCPGPVEVFSGKLVQLIIFNSEWWLHQHSKPSSEADGCPTWSKQQVLSNFRKLLTRSQNKIQIVLQHHPLQSYGPHGNGSGCQQDLLCGAYQELRSQQLKVLNRVKPLICAAGHDHSMQVIRGNRGCQYFLVSGATSNASYITPGPRLQFGKASVGFLQLDIYADKKAKLSAIVPSSSDANGNIIFSKYLSDKRSQRRYS